MNKEEISELIDINHATTIIRAEVQLIDDYPYIVLACTDSYGFIAGTDKPIELNPNNTIKITNKDELSAILSVHKEALYQKYLKYHIALSTLIESYNLYIPEDVDPDTVVEYVYVHKCLNVSIFRMKSGRLLTVGSICEYFEDPSDDQFDKICDKCAIAEYIWTHKKVIEPLLSIDSVADKARAAYNITV